MNIDDIMYEFVSIGILEESQFRVYKFLFEASPKYPTKVSNIATQLGMNRTFTYEVLKILHSLKLVDIVNKSPKEYIARKPTSFINIQIQKLQLKIRRIRVQSKLWEEFYENQVSEIQEPHIQYEAPSSCGMYNPPEEKRY